MENLTQFETSQSELKLAVASLKQRLAASPELLKAKRDAQTRAANGKRLGNRQRCQAKCLALSLDLATP